jgi:hypothetical protein
MNKQFLKPCGGETKNFTITLQDEALALKAVNEAKQVLESCSDHKTYCTDSQS